MYIIHFPGHIVNPLWKYIHTDSDCGKIIYCRKPKPFPPVQSKRGRHIHEYSRTYLYCIFKKRSVKDQRYAKKMDCGRAAFGNTLFSSAHIGRGRGKDGHEIVYQMGGLYSPRPGPGGCYERPSGHPGKRLCHRLDRTSGVFGGSLRR